jgi:hypothetical protein
MRRATIRKLIACHRFDLGGGAELYGGGPESLVVDVNQPAGLLQEDLHCSPCM